MTKPIEPEEIEYDDQKPKMKSFELYKMSKDEWISGIFYLIGLVAWHIIMGNLIN